MANKEHSSFRFLQNRFIIFLLKALLVAATLVAFSNGIPVNRQERAAEPLDILGAVTRGVGFNRRPNQGLKKYVIMYDYLYT